MLARLLFAVTLALVLALPAAADAHHGGSGIVGPTRIGDLIMDVSTEADVRAFAGTPDTTDVEPAFENGILDLGYHCRGRDGCETNYQIDRATDTLFGFATESRRFRTSRGTRVGDTRKRAQRRERRKVNLNLCGGGTRGILREIRGHYLYILLHRRRVFELIVDSSFVWC